ncbi:hypothetical protein ACFFTN_19360 [Aminobacter aganoensis]|uniref:Uncharacterized protein n=1 Tax=Aminobacter aganoensis TaxID=83264 RepID=A0A7X0F3U6_9HYPH|nr:hypothetical protein [Aminobacter aganoensis]
MAKIFQFARHMAALFSLVKGTGTKTPADAGNTTKGILIGAIAIVSRFATLLPLPVGPVSQMEIGAESCARHWRQDKGKAKHMHKPPPTRRRAETLDYIQSMLGQLRVMAEAERCGMLAYLIEMAYVEAGDARRVDRPSGLGINKRNTSA